MSTPNLHVGTSGYSYKEWKGSFYADKLRAKQMLRSYGERFDTVEINSSFYRVPSASAVEAWAADADDDLKVPFAATTDWGYMRLRRAEYNDAALKGWAKRVHEQQWRDAFVYFKHEDEGRGPKFAVRLQALAAQ